MKLLIIPGFLVIGFILFAIRPPSTTAIFRGFPVNQPVDKQLSSRLIVKFKDWQTPNLQQVQNINNQIGVAEMKPLFTESSVDVTIPYSNEYGQSVVAATNFHPPITQFIVTRQPPAGVRILGRIVSFGINQQLQILQAANVCGNQFPVAPNLNVTITGFGTYPVNRCNLSGPHYD